MSPSTTANRLRYLDWMRGVAALIMLQGHTFHSFTRADLRDSGPYVLSQFLGGIAPAVFLFLTGVTMAFRMDSNERRGLKPIARIVSGGVCGVDPDIMGIGPAPSSRQALKRAGLKIEDMDLVEINEAFATQYLAVEKDLGLDRDKTNVNGGAIALGHPLGASGARLALTLVAELHKRNGKYGLASLCIGGGQGIAAIFERI